MDELKKIEKILSDKLIVRIDKTKNDRDLSNDFVVIFINPEKKEPGHVTIKIPCSDKKFLEEFKKVLIKKFDVTIRGFKNWKKAIKEC